MQTSTTTLARDDDQAALASQTMRRVNLRLVPFLLLLFIVAQIDRSNIGFAALTMNQEIGLTPYWFGVAAGMFFAGYTVLEIPSNILMNGIGARRWIARIMVTWGMVSAATMFVQGTASLIVMRFLLGVAEAGFLPGITLYILWWIPASRRAGAQSVVLLAAPLAGVLGGPLAGLLFQMNGVAGLRGWQWMFLVEGIPAIILGFVCLRFLTDRPADAHWLSDEERGWLTSTLAREHEAKQTVGSHRLSAGLTDPRVIYLGILYIGLIMGLYGINVWLPTIIKGLSGLDNLQVALLGAVPFGIAGVCSVVWAVASDRFGRHNVHAAAALILGAFGFAASALVSSPTLAIVFLVIAACGVFSALPTFWTLPSSFLGGAAAAAGIALINSLGNIGGFAGPFFVGWIKDATGSFTNALLLLAGMMALSGVMALLADRIGPAQRRGQEVARVPRDASEPA